MNRLNISPTEFITHNAAGTRTFDSEYSYIKVKPGEQLIPDFNAGALVAVMNRNTTKINQFGFWVGDLPSSENQTTIIRTIDLPRSTQVIFTARVPGIPTPPDNLTIPGQVTIKYNGVLLETRNLYPLLLWENAPGVGTPLPICLPDNSYRQWIVDLTPAYTDIGGEFEVAFTGLNTTFDNTLSYAVSTIHVNSHALGVG